MLFGPEPEPLEEPTDVVVWSYTNQCFVPSYPCEGVKRVRIDEYEPLTNFAVYKVAKREGNTFILAQPVKPLTDWIIDYT